MIRKTTRAAAILTLALLLAACGGGGGGGDQSGGAANGGPGGGTLPNTTLQLDPTSVPRSFKMEGYGDTSLAGTILLHYSGDSSALAGKSIYVQLALPHAFLFKPQPEVEHRPAQSIVLFTLSGDVAGWATPGHFTGTMKVYVCLDPSCSTQLPNSPVEVPYDVTVHQGLALSQDKVEVRSAFGSRPEPVVITLTRPEGLVSWSVDDTNGSATLSGDKLIIQPPYEAPGTYTRDLTVLADTNPPWMTVPQFMRSRVTLNYTVDPSPVPYVMAPLSGRHVATASNPVDLFQFIQLVGQGGTFASRGIRYDTAPAAATGHPLASQWVMASDFLPNYRVNACARSAGTPCLPQGTYTAAWLWSYTGNGQKTDFEFPITLTVNP